MKTIATLLLTAAVIAVLWVDKTPPIPPARDINKIVDSVLNDTLVGMRRNYNLK